MRVTPVHIRRCWKGVLVSGTAISGIKGVKGFTRSRKRTAQTTQVSELCYTYTTARGALQWFIPEIPPNVMQRGHDLEDPSPSLFFSSHRIERGGTYDRS